MQYYLSRFVNLDDVERKEIKKCTEKNKMKNLFA